MERCGRRSRRGGSIVDRRFYWLDPSPLIESRNQVIGQLLGDPTNARRQAWMRSLGRTQHDDLIVQHSVGEDVAFLLMGDTGEGDASQYAVITPLLSQAEGTAFLFICSDVIYPAGGIGEYGGKLACPYRDYPSPIYGIPGNHDWYDDGQGFMHWFCGAEQAPQAPPPGLFSRGWLRDRLWRRPPTPDPADVPPRPSANQPAPYFAIDAGPLRLVGIDTGMGGPIDADQGRWLQRISQGPRPKILLTGKPIYVDADYHRGDIDGGGHIDDIVTDPANHYIAAIGGDIHNYQRYLVTVPDGRRLAYIVSGGGGAFMHQTHTLPNLDRVRTLRGKVSEAEFRCYPLRGDSLARYSQLYAHKLPVIGGRALGIAPDEAAAIASQRTGIPPTRPSAHQTDVSARARKAADVLYRLPARGRGSLHVPFSEWLDWNEPPMFKHFLRIDATEREVRLRCVAGTGCAQTETDPPIEDELLARRGDDGAWIWEVAA